MLTKGHYTYLSKTVFVTTQIKPNYLHKIEYISQYRVVIFKIKKNYSNTKSYPFFWECEAIQYVTLHLRDRCSAVNFTKSHKFDAVSQTFVRYP